MSTGIKTVERRGLLKDTDVTRETTRKNCEKEGLLYLGISPTHYPEDYNHYRTWLSENRHAGLKYLEENQHLRADPGALLPGAKSVICAALPYYRRDDSPAPKVALYAQYRDYHRVLREKLERVALASVQGTFRVAVDSAPILERALAARTSRGFVGKNTLFIHPEHGSFLLLGEILTTDAFPIDEKKPLPLDRKTKDGGCGPCKLCQVACPTGALDRDYSMDASKCLAYWTIENRGTIPEIFWPHLPKYYFGCDLCQLACPYNLRPSEAPEDWKAKSYPSIDEVAMMSQPNYETWFGGTPLTRAKRSGLRRNALIAMAVLRHPLLEKALTHISTDGGFPLEATREQIGNFLYRETGTLSGLNR